MIWTLLRPFAPYIALGLVASHGGVYVLGRAHGADSEKRAEAKRLEKARKVIVKREAKADAITDKTADKLQAETVRIEYRTKYLEREVVRYVTPEADAAYRLPIGFRLLHDAAAQGGEAVLSEAARGSVEPDPTLTISAAVGAVVGNYGVCHAYRAENVAWRDWYTLQRAAWEAKP